MNCKACGTFNGVGAKFCIKCGASLIEQPQNTMQAVNNIPNNQIVQPSVQGMGSEEISMNVQPNPSFQGQNNVQPNPSFQGQNNIQIDPQQNVLNNSINTKISFKEYLSTILAVVLKPFSGFEKEQNKLNKFKNSLILSLIITAFIVIVTLITNMIDAITVESYSFKEGKIVTELVFGNLKEVEYLKVFGRTALIYLGVIFIISGLYYIASLIIKKQANYPRLVSILALSIVPFSICSLVLSPLISLISVKLGLAVTVVGALYTFLIMYEGINNEIKLEGNPKYYFNLVCLVILVLAGSFIISNYITNSIMGGLGDLGGLGDFGDLSSLFD